MSLLEKLVPRETQMYLELALNFLVTLRDMCNRDSIKRLTLDLKFQL